MQGSGMNLVTTVIGFGMSLTFIVFICARLICSRIRSEDSQAAAFHADPPEHLSSGLEPAAIEAIPTIKYSRETFHSGGDAQCTICLGEYQEKEILRIIPTCGHNFHISCIDLWLQKQSTCPICRFSLNGLIEPKDVAFQSVNRSEVSNDHANEDSQESASVVVGFAHV